MKNTKNIAIVAALFFSMTAFGQAKEIKLNVLGAAFSNYTLGYEHGLSETGSVGLWVNYAEYGTGDNKIQGLGFIPEYRFYFSPDDEIDGFFVGPYAKYTTLSNTYDISAPNSTGVTETYNTKVSVSRIGLGLNLGRKWATDGGFVFETALGFGKFLSNNVSYNVQEVQDYYDDLDDDYILFAGIDLRLAISVGYRF